MHPTKVTLIGFLTLAVSMPCFALRSDRDKPIDIKADKVEVNEVNEVSYYKGNVHLQQGSMNINADKITVRLKHGKLDKIIIDGHPATFEQLPEDRRDIVRSTARNMEYYANKQLLILKQDASVVQGANHFSGDFIEYDTLNSTVKANKDVDSSSRVHAIIQPGKDAGDPKKEPAADNQPTETPTTENQAPGEPEESKAKAPVQKDTPKP